MGQLISNYKFNNWIQVDDLEDGRYLLTFSDEGLDLLRYALAGVIKNVEPAKKDFTAVWDLVLQPLLEAEFDKKFENSDDTRYH